MEKRNWLWKRKSSEKSSGETESSGSISSHSERYSDEQEAVKGSPDHNTQSPEVSSKAVARSEVIDESSPKIDDANDTVKILTERLSAALVNVSAKEDLVKQHAKVAEEAVAGWEKAENEVAIVKIQLESVLQQKSGLEDRASHLDGALKECVRQLRLARDEYEQKIHDTLSLKTLEWESTKCILESKLVELQNRPEPSSDICLKLEFLEKENSALRLEIHDQMEELEVRTIERDLSTQAAESASKQHLESIKKVAKLEAECRRLRATASKSPSSNHLSSLGSIRRSDSWASALVSELDQFKSEKSNGNKNIHNSSVDINLMDDFLEMERFAATETKSDSPESESESQVSVLRAELEAMTHRTAELEQKLTKLETEKAELESRESKDETCFLREELDASTRRTGELEDKLKGLEKAKNELENQSRVVENDLRTKLDAVVRRTDELEETLEKLEMEKAELENGSQTLESGLRSKLEAMIQRTTELECELEKLVNEKKGSEEEFKCKESVMRTELETTSQRMAELEEKLEELRSGRAELESKLEILETEKSDLEDKLEKLETEKAELEANESERGESVLRAELAMTHQKAELEEELEKLGSEKAEIEAALTESREQAEASHHRLEEAELKIEELRKELRATRESKEMIESQLVSVEAEARTVSAKMSLLEDEVRREREFSKEIAARCRELEDELSSMEREEVTVRESCGSNTEIKIKQEDLAVAAGKLAECQKTIASLGNQLKSLATLEDFLIDNSTNIPAFSANVNPRTGEHWRLHSNQTFSPKRDFGHSKMGDPNTSPVHSLVKSHDEPSPPSSTSSSSSTSAMVVSGGSEKNRNGFAKFFSRTKSGIRLEI